VATEPEQDELKEIMLMIRACELSVLPSDSPERHLLSAIFERALEDALLEPNTREKIALRNAARSWLWKNQLSEREEGFTFLDIAHELDISVKRVRRFLLENRSWSTSQCQIRPRIRRVS
jgi:hypothetical protein